MLERAWNLLYLTSNTLREVDANSREMQPGIYIAHMRAPAPGPVLLLKVFVLSVCICGLIAFSAIWLQRQDVLSSLQSALLPTLLLSVNNTIRNGMRYREQIARLAVWPTPVARQRMTTRVLFCIFGIATGAAAAFFLWQANAATMSPTFGKFLMVLFACVDGYRNATKLGTCAEDEYLNTELFTTWTLLEAAPARNHAASRFS